MGPKRIVLVFEGVDASEDAKAALLAYKWQATVEDVDRWLRDLAKHEGKTSVAIDDVRDRLHEGAPEPF